MDGKCKILVIDDSELVLKATRLVLEEAGYVVSVLHGAVGCGAAIIREMPSLVLLDVSMPLISGMDLLAKIQNNPRLGGTSVALYSSRPEAELKRLAEKHRADGFIVKTGDRDELLEQVEQVLARRRRSLTPAGLPIESDPVLFVDDDNNLLSVYRRHFAPILNAGYSKCAFSALDQITSARPPRVVVTDVVMPGLSGVELLERAVQFDPTWTDRFLFITGHAVTSESVRDLETTKRPIFYKPVVLTDLEPAINALL